MSDNPASGDSTLQPSASRRVDEACDRFEAAWKAAGQSGEPPHIENYLESIPEQERAHILGELVLIEIYYRRKRGEQPEAKQYLARFPKLDPAWLKKAISASVQKRLDTTVLEAKVGESASAETSGKVIRIRCPHCHNPIVIVEDQSDEVLCPGCGSTFRLRDARQTTTTKPMRPLGKFRLLERVGLGAFGAVWRAKDTELDRIVALKIPHSGLLTEDEELERFRREARAAAQLRHPGIVTVHEVLTLDGLPTLVCDFVTGVPLKDLIEARRLTFRESARLVADIAEALDYAHRMGVVHRDLKPANIMIETGGLSGEEIGGADNSSLATCYSPRIMDFGLALRDEGEITMTLDGQILGTPAYMSPEQAEGKGHRAERRSDIYTIGVILYELLTGDLPFRGSKMMILHQVLHEEPRPPRKVNDKIPRDLETICLKAMAKLPARRYQTAGEFVNDLRLFLKGEAILARPVGRTERLWRWCRRNPDVASLTAAIAVLLVAGTAIAMYFAIDATIARNRADAKAKEALGSAQKEADERERAEEARREAVKERATTQRTLDFARRGLMTSHLLRARLLYDQDPFEAWELLHDENVCPPDLRDFCWRLYNYQFSKAGNYTTFPVPEQVTAISFTPDGKSVVSGGKSGKVKRSGNVRVWDIATGQLSYSMRRNMQPIEVEAIAVGGDGAVIVVSADKIVRLWNPKAGSPM